MNYFEDCMKCTDRTAGCHAVCDKYINAKKKYTENKEKIDAMKHQKTEYDSYKYNHTPSRYHSMINKGR